MKQKNIAFVTPIYLPAPLYGSDNAVRILAEEFARVGHNVSIITSDAYTPRYWYDPFFGKKIPKTARNRINGVRVIRLKSHQLISSFTFMLSRFAGRFLPITIRNILEIIASGPYLIGLSEVLGSEQPDVIHCSPFPLNINKQVIDTVAKFTKKPKVILTPFFHAHVSTYHNRGLGNLMRHADVIHAVSNAEKQDIESIFPEANVKVQVIPLYLRTMNLHGPSELQKDVLKFKQKYHLVRKKIVLIAGLKGHMKGALDTLRAVEQLHKNDPNILLIAIGHNTVEWNAMKEKIHPESLLDFDYVDEYTKELLFSACDVFCMPSKSESFGYVYLEAWHKKKPVIAASIGPVQELIEKNHAGVMVKYGDRPALEKAIRMLLAQTQKARALGQNGYKVLTEMYNEKKLFHAYQVLFGV